LSQRKKSNIDISEKICYNKTNIMGDCPYSMKGNDYYEAHSDSK